MTDAQETFRRRMLEGARNYAASEKSDPFAYERALTHIVTGVAGLDSQGRDAFYQATPYQEERVTADGTPYMVTVYKNIERP